MENKDKLRVLLKHWIEHNSGHVEEFAKWQNIMSEEQDAATAGSLQQAMAKMDQVSDILQEALDNLGGPLDSGDDHHHHHHHH
jgi:hypothetical protein